MNIYLGSKNYKIIKELGFGSYGRVYKVLDEKEKKYYALKKIEFKEFSEEELNLYENEAKLLSSIKNEHIVKYYDSSKDNEFFYILMEYCEGLDLKQFIKQYKSKNEKIDEESIYNIVSDICLGIKEIHQKNLIHRDLKPENILIDKYNVIKIGDFGISKLLENNNKYANTSVGTNNYMAPELIKGDKHNNKVDIGALGCIIYELLTLNVCFESKSLYGIIDKIIKKPHGKIDKNIYNHKWQNIIDLLLKKDYRKRPDINKVYNLVIDLGKELHKNKKNYKNNSTDLVPNNVSKKRMRIINQEEINELNIENQDIIDIRSKNNIFNFFIHYIVVIVGVSFRFNFFILRSMNRLLHKLSNLTVKLSNFKQITSDHDLKVIELFTKQVHLITLLCFNLDDLPSYNMIH